jgi:hypothetical protein
MPTREEREARRAWGNLATIGLRRAASDGALASMKEGLAQGVDPGAMTAFSNLLVEAENADNPTLSHMLEQAKEILEMGDVSDWMREVRDDDTHAAHEFVKQLEEQQEKANSSYEAWLKQQERHKKELEEAYRKLLEDQQKLVESTQKDTFELDKGPDKDLVAEARASDEYATANEKVNRLQADLDSATNDLNAFNEANPDTVKDYREARKEVDDLTTMAIAEARGDNASAESIRMSPVLALMSSSLRPEVSEIAAAREQVADQFTSAGSRQALVDAIKSQAVMTRDVAIESLLKQYDAATSDADKKALCADMVIHLRQTPEFNDYLAAPGYEDVRDQVDLVKDVDNVGSLYLRNPQAIMALAEQVGMDPEMRKPYETATKLLPGYSHYLELTAKRDEIQFQHDAAQIARERVVSSYVASNSLHAAVVDGRQAIETVDPGLALLCAPQLAALRRFEDELKEKKDKDPKAYQELVASPEAQKMRALATKLKEAGKNYLDFKTKYGYAFGVLRQTNSRTMSTGYVAIIKDRDAVNGQEMYWGSLFATQGNSEQSLYGGKGSFLWQHMNSTWRTIGLAFGLIKTPLQAYRKATKIEAEERGFKMVMQTDTAGRETGLFRFVRNDGSNRPATKQEHQDILREASTRTAKNGREHMNVVEAGLIDLDTKFAERAGQMGFEPTNAVPKPGREADSTALKQLDANDRERLSHKIQDTGPDAIDRYGELVNKIKPRLSADKKMLIFDGPGFNFGTDGDGIAMRVEPVAQQGKDYRVKGGDPALGITFRENDAGDVEFYREGGNTKLNDVEVKEFLAGTAVKDPGVEILGLTRTTKERILTKGDPGAQVPGRGAQATDIKGPKVPGGQAENAPTAEHNSPTPT